MKKTLADLLMIVAALALLWAPVGCATTPDTDPDARVARVTESLAMTGSAIALMKDPEYRPVFEQAAAALASLAEDDSISLAAVLGALQPLPVKEFKSPEAVLIVGSVQMILEEFGTVGITLDKVPQLQAVAGGLAAGFNRTLASTQ